MSRGPGIVGEQLPVVARHVAARRGCRQDLLHRPRIGQRDVENPAVALDAHAAGQPCDLRSVRPEQDHRGVAHHAKALALLLCARRVAVQVDRHEQAAALLELPPIEDRRLDLRAGRAPLGAPVQEQWLGSRPCSREGGVDIAVEPRDAGRPVVGRTCVKSHPPPMPPVRRRPGPGRRVPCVRSR